jgi:hypothetical protein
MKKLFSFLAMFLVFMFFVAPMPIFADGDGWVEDAGGNMIITNEMIDISLLPIATERPADADYLFYNNSILNIPAPDCRDVKYNTLTQASCHENGNGYMFRLAVFWYGLAEIT